MREKYDGRKSTFGYVPEPPKGGDKRLFLCLTIVCLLVAGICFGTVARQALVHHRAAAIAAAQRLAVSQAAAVQRRMTVFPKYHKAVKSKMSDYQASGAGSAGVDGVYAENGTYDSKPAYQLDPTHWLFYQDNNTCWVLGSEKSEFLDTAYYAAVSDASTPDGLTWSNSGCTGDSPAPTVALDVPPPDTTAPVIDTVTGVSISKVGSVYKLSIPITETGTVSGTNGFSLSGLVHGAVMLSAQDITDNVVSYTLSRNIYNDETAIKLNYTPGDFADDASNALAAVSNVTVTNNSTQEYVPMPITFTIDTGADKALAVPTTSDDDVTIGHTQAGSDGNLVIPARVPMLNKNFSVRQAAAIGSLDAADPLEKVMLTNFDLSALVNPIWFFDENEETFLSHVDGEEPVKKLGLRLAKSSSDLATIEAQKNTQPATPMWYQQRAVHADNSKYSFKSEFYASPNASATLGAGNNVRYKEFPLGTVISGLGYAARFTVTQPA